MSVLGISAAAAALGVSPRRVRQMVADGVLAGERVGRAWVIEQSVLESVRSRGRRAGRPWRAASAWAVLALASGEDVDVSAVERSRARQRLKDVGLVDLVPKLASRAELQRFYVHPSLLDEIEDVPGVVRSGASASPDHGLDLVAPGVVEAYVRAGEIAALVERFALDEGAERANVILHVVDDNVWPFEAGLKVAPAAVVAVDLLEADDDRSRRAGADLAARL